MLFGLIQDDGFGTRITGRAGSDLNGLILTALALPLLVFILFEMVAADQSQWKNVAIICALIIFALLVFWWAHQDRRQAEPLVRFLRDALTSDDQLRHTAPASDAIYQGMSLHIGGQARSEPTSAMAVHLALLDLSENDFVILEAAPEKYIQTMSQNGSFIIEMRRGAGQHFQAARRGAPDTEKARFNFSFEEAREALTAFGSGADAPWAMVWLPMSPRD